MDKSSRGPARPSTVTTPRLVLSPLTVDDAGALFEYRSAPEVRRFQPFEPRSPDDARQFIAAGLTEAPTWRQYGLRLKESAELVGDIGYKLDSEWGLQAELGITLSPAHQHRGLATEAVKVLVGHLFDTLSLHRVFASIDPRNEPSLRLFERLGFRREAHLRQSLWFKGEWVDDVIFAMLESEWRSNR
jgi:RimJ/RimL family protein N-acetyltransferase